MKPKSKIEYFALIMQKIAENKLPCSNHLGQCVYRSEKGEACIAGLLITDEDYKKYIDEENNTKVFSQIQYCEQMLPNWIDVKTVSELQAQHDKTVYNKLPKERFIFEVSKILFGEV